MEIYNGGEVVFKEGDPSNDKLYMVYAGTCMLMRTKKLEKLNEDDVSPRKRRQTT